MATLRNRLPKALSFGGVALLLGVVAACGGGTELKEDADGNLEVSVRTDVYYNGATLPLVVGVQEGIFEEHGLSVDLNEGKESATTIQTVSNGSDHIGYVDAGTLVQSVAQGINAKMIAGMVQESPLALYAMPDSGISKPADLEGKTAGYTPGSAAERVFPAYAQAAGIDQESVQFRNVDVPTRTELFMAGKTDFTFGLRNVSQPNIALQCKCDPVEIPYSDEGIAMLSSGIIASDDLIEDNPEALEKFLAGLVESVEFVNENPDKAVDAFFEFAPDTDVDPKVVAQQWKTSMELSQTPAGKGQDFGCMTSEDWESTIDLMEKYGDVPAGEVEVSDISTNSLLPGTCTDGLGGE